MDCRTLAETGSDVLPLVLVAAGLIVAGICLLVRAARTRTAHAAGLVAVLLVLVGLGTVSPPTARAADGCASPDLQRSLTITQTSSMTGLVPHGAPVAITGRVTNTGQDDTYIHDVVVSIAAVTKAAGAPRGRCDARDYELGTPLMTLARPLPAGGTETFAGATIRFRHTAVNQDGCKGAAISLLYTTG